VQATHPDIPDRTLLGLLGEILRPAFTDRDTSALRIKMLRPGFPWQTIVVLAQDQGVLLPLIDALGARSLAPPIPRSRIPDGHVSVRLANVHAAHLAFRRRQLRQMEDLLSILAQAGVTPLLLKGIRYLAAPPGSWSAARTMGDFDILVRPDQALGAHAAFARAGYRQPRNVERPYRSPHHLPPLEHPDHPMPVELHVEALTAVAGTVLSTDRLWRVAVKHDTRPVMVLPPVWQALHGMLHHQVQDRGHHLRKLCIKGLWEWSMLAHSFSGEDWNLLDDHVRTTDAREILDSWSCLANHLFSLDAPWLADVSAAARAHAALTLNGAMKPYWMRRVAQIGDEVRTAFARETLAARYGLAPTDISLVHAGRYLAELGQRHRGGMLRRLTGSNGSP
jgi:hypothetical protein